MKKNVGNQPKLANVLLSHLKATFEDENTACFIIISLLIEWTANKEESRLPESVEKEFITCICSRRGLLSLGLRTIQEVEDVDEEAWVGFISKILDYCSLSEPKR